MDNPAGFAPDAVRTGMGTSGPERNWPFDCWWVAAHASEVTATPTMRWILEMPLVLYRGEGGRVVALHNRCPHRWAPLHAGEVSGDDIVCPYHGMRFDASGQCVKVPTQEKTPSAIRVRSFPIVEQFGFVWIWTGDPEFADEGLIPQDLAYLSDATWHNVWGYKAVNANFMQMKENVLDLTHFAFLHKNSIGVSGWDRAPAVEMSGDQVTYRQLFDMEPLPPVYALPAGKTVGKKVDRNNWGTMLTAAVNHGAVDMYDPEPEPNGLSNFKFRVVHMTTPVSLGKCHYYWAFARDHGEPFDVEETRRQANFVFGEDIMIVEAIQEMARCAIDQDDAVEYSVTADSAAVQGRRIVQSKVAAEAKRREAAV